MSRIVIFGAGTDGRLLLPKLRQHDHEVLAFADNSPLRQGTCFEGLPVLAPDRLSAMDFDVIHLALPASAPVAQQLATLGIGQERLRSPLFEPANQAGIAALRNAHQGQEAWIIGNGPSLRISDLTALQERGALTFAFNKIYLAFGESPFRPTYYLVEDLLVAENNAIQIKGLGGFYKLFPESVLRYLGQDQETTVFGLSPLPKEDEAINISQDPNWFYCGATVTYVAIQWALFMGFKTIYLIGIDFSFMTAGLATMNESKVFISCGEINHFHPDYRKLGELWMRPYMDIQARAFRTARIFTESEGIGIFNATRGGFLEIFPRVDLDIILST